MGSWAVISNYCLLKGPPCIRGAASQPATLSPVNDGAEPGAKRTAVTIAPQKTAVPILGISYKDRTAKSVESWNYQLLWFS